MHGQKNIIKKAWLVTKVPVVLYDNLQRESHRPYGHPTSVTSQKSLRRHTNTSTSTSPTAETHWSTRTRLRALYQTCDISRGSLTLPAPEAGNFVELILLHSPLITENALDATSVCSVRITSRIVISKYSVSVGDWSVTPCSLVFTVMGELRYVSSGTTL